MSDATKLAQRITPGEWRAFGNLIRSGAKTVAKVCVLTDENEEQANAELIAAAPDLLAQRDALLAALQAIVKAHPDADSMGAIADAAIKLVESAE